MIVIAHRAQDYKKDIPRRFGVEIDVRDAYGGAPYLSHDPVNITPDYETQSAPLYYWLQQEGDVVRPAYAVNIKADGIEQKLVDAFAGYPNIWGQTFFFDGSFPTMRRLKHLNVPVAERISEEEPYRGWSHIIWLDRWDWADGEGPVLGRGQTATGKICKVPLIQYETNKKTEIYAVSPELHIPNCQPSFRRYWWRRFQEMGCAGICTDHWLECEEFLK